MSYCRWWQFWGAEDDAVRMGRCSFIAWKINNSITKDSNKCRACDRMPVLDFLYNAMLKYQCVCDITGTGLLFISYLLCSRCMSSVD